jgi:hypothetical protein
MASTQYTPPNAAYNNNSANPLGSFWGQLTGREQAILERIVYNKIVDSAPQQFYDLKLLMDKTPEQKTSDEHEWFEAPYDRYGLPVNASSVAVTWPTTQNVTLVSGDNVTLNMVLTYPNNKQGTVTAIVGNVITVTPMQNDSLPAIGAGDVLTFASQVEGDSSTNITNYYRLNLQRKYNYIYLLSIGMRYGFVEMLKYKSNNYLPQFLAKERDRMLQNFRVSMSNQLWMGKKGMMFLADGSRVKMMGGILNEMLAAGSPTISTPVSSFGDAVEASLLNTMGGPLGQEKFLFATPTRILQLSKQFKSALTRYTPNDMVAKLNLNKIDLGSASAVLVPNLRFQDRSSYPAAWENYAFVLQKENIKTVKLLGYDSAWTLEPRNNGGPTLNNFYEFGMSSSLGLQFEAPQYSALITIQ